MIKVSFNIVSRNDKYYSNNLQILSQTINTNLFFLDKINKRSLVEFNILDWGSIDPLHQNILINEKYKKNVNFYYVNKETADNLSINYPNKFNLNKAPNLAVRLSKGEFVIQATSDQILSRAGWFNLLNFIENKKFFNLDTDNTVFYIPRKILEYDFYKKDPSIEILENFLNHYNSSYMKTKNSLFFLGGGYSLLCNKKLIENMGGINNEVNNPNSGNDVDLNIRFKRLGINQIDTNSLGIVFYKFPSDVNSVRNQLLKSKRTRQYPALPLNDYPNGENWGMKNEKVKIYEPNKTIKNFDQKNEKKLVLDQNFATKFIYSKQLSILSKFHKLNFDLKEWVLVFQIIKIISANRIFSLTEFGFDNINRLISIGQELKSLEILSIDIECDKSEYIYLNRLGKVQEVLSRNRFGKFTPLNTINFKDFNTNMDQMKLSNGTNLFLINLASIKSKDLLDNIKNQINKFEKYTSYVILWDKLNKNIQIPNIENHYQKIYSKNKIQIFINKKYKQHNYDNSILNINFYNIFNLASLYLVYSIYCFFSSMLKIIHKKIFRFKY